MIFLWFIVEMSPIYPKRALDLSCLSMLVSLDMRFLNSGWFDEMSRFEEFTLALRSDLEASSSVVLNSCTLLRSWDYATTISPAIALLSPCFYLCDFDCDLDLLFPLWSSSCFSSSNLLSTIWKGPQSSSASDRFLECLSFFFFFYFGSLSCYPPSGMLRRVFGGASVAVYWT